MINVNLAFGANLDRKENSISCSGRRTAKDDGTNHDNEGAVLEIATDRELRQRQVQGVPTGKVRVWDSISISSRITILQAQSSSRRPRHRVSGSW